MELGLELLTERCSRVAVARASSRVYKDECIYSFDNPVRKGASGSLLAAPFGVLAAFVPRVAGEREGVVREPGVLCRGGPRADATPLPNDRRTVVPQHSQVAKTQGGRTWNVWNGVRDELESVHDKRKRIKV